MTQDVEIVRAMMRELDATMREELTSEQCTRANILGAVGVLGWAMGLSGDVAHPVMRVAEERAGLLCMLACWSGGLPQRSREYRWSRLVFKAEIRKHRGALAEDAGHADLAETHYVRACELRAQATLIQYGDN